MPSTLLRHCIIVTLVVLSAGVHGQEKWNGIEKIVAVGDLHGDYEQYIQVLKNNGLLDDELEWAGGTVHFVQLGDIPDRGPDSMKIIRHMMRLEKQASKAGGMVHALIGNHEAMNISTDLRYVHPGEYEALVTRRSARTRISWLERIYETMLVSQVDLADPKQVVMERLGKQYPLGYVEHRKLWEPGRPIAKWVAKHNVVVMINDTLFVHGGLSPHEELKSLSSINKEFRRELSRRRPGPQVVDPQGPLWYRGLAMNSADEELEPLKNMLAFYEASRIVVAHSTTKGAVIPRFGGLVVLIDVGISTHYGGSMANLVIDAGSVFANHQGELVRLPEGGDLKSYLMEVTRLEPEGSRLLKYVQSTQQPMEVTAEND